MLDEKFVKKPLIIFNFHGKEMFRIEVDDLDLEIITVPFASDEPSAFVRSFGILQKFVNHFGDFIKNIPEGEHVTLQQVFKDIKDKISYTHLEIIQSDKINLSDIKIFKRKNFEKLSFKPQFSIQTNLQNFLLYYFHLFSSEKMSAIPPMQALKKVMDLKINDFDVMDPIQNFNILYLYMCSSPEFSGRGMALGNMAENNQCDYKMYLPIMPRVPLSDLQLSLKGNFYDFLEKTFPGYREKILPQVGFYEFGDFYPVALAKNLKNHLEGVEKLLRGELLEKGIITTGTILSLNSSAFINKEAEEKIKNYIKKYGEETLKSLIHPFFDKKIDITFDHKIRYSESRIKKDKLSPPFLSLSGNSMGAVSVNSLDPKYGKFLFEVRRANTLGEYFKDMINGYFLLQLIGNSGRDYYLRKRFKEEAFFQHIGDGTITRYFKEISNKESSNLPKHLQYIREKRELYKRPLPGRDFLQVASYLYEDAKILMDLLNTGKEDSGFEEVLGVKGKEELIKKIRKEHFQ